MKQIDNRQKQQILSRAQKTWLGKNPFLPKEKEKLELPRPSVDVSQKPEEGNVPVPKIEPYHAPPKVGRNNPCPCGSGKKFKKCCLDKPESSVPEVKIPGPGEAKTDKKAEPVKAKSPKAAPVKGGKKPRKRKGTASKTRRKR